MREFVSIIVPIFNVENHLNKCLDSILNQTYKNIEIILINDGSTDGSGEICDIYSKRHNNIVVVHKENEGVSVARNKGIQIAKGKFIQFVDSDDFLEKNMTDTLMKEVKIDATLPICNIEIYYKDKRLRHDLIPVKKKVSCSIQQYLTNFIVKYKTNPFIGSPCNKIFIKDIIINNKIMFQEDRSFAEDFLFNIEYLYYIEKVTIINESLYHYRLDTLSSLTKVAKPVEFWWDNYKQIYVLYLDIFNYYGLFKKNKESIKLFMEFAVMHCIKICFRSKCKLTYSEKVQKLKYVCEDNLTQELITAFECKDFYMKIVRFFTKYKLYQLLGFILIVHSFLVDIYKTIQKIKNTIFEVIDNRRFKQKFYNIH
ncbi:glycosyltransferase [Acetobacterium bakii]|uniref:glycosyltransferase n=1 Tax=Acetobacterium bakii TaxID=52689 RepID=UPI000680A88F|nr:glycosyltransferase [Acetobacterium bakii]